jgi:DNA-binding NtrC family response regulator
MQQLKLLFGNSPAGREVLGKCEQWAASPYPLLILGERGTGKTMLAERIHELSGLPGAFVPQSVAWLPEQLALAELVGYSRGAFTGAYQSRSGLLEAASKGTFFLDELGLASPKIQEVLLQVLDGRPFRRLGDERERQVNLRLIAATNADLPAMVKRGSFRQDLLDRFGYLVLRVPRLAERPDVIIPLAEVFVQEEAAVLKRPPPELGDQVKESFLTAPWEGNIRDLRSVIRYALLNSRPGEPVHFGSLPPDFIATLGDVQQARYEADVQRARAALERAGGNVSKAARELGMSRTRVYKLLTIPDGEACEL